MAKTVVNDVDIKDQILSGVNQLADAVKTTLGLKGRNSVIERQMKMPLITNDGATIAKEIELKGAGENIGAQLIKEVSAKTNDLAGDGTTTATVLAQCIIQEGFRNIAAGANPVELKKGILGAAQLTVKAISKLSRPVETKEAIAQVATISSDDPEIGSMIAEAMAVTGQDGVITVEEGKTLETTLEVIEGMQFERGYLHPAMANPETLVAELENPYILITDRKITNAHDLLPIFEQVVPTGRSLLIIADGLEGEAFSMTVLNKMRGVLNVVAVMAPAYGDGRKARLEDLAIMTGAAYICEQLGHTLREVTLDMLGSADLVKVEKQNTMIVGGHGVPEQIRVRRENLRKLAEKNKYDFDKKQLMERLAKLSCGVAVVHAGGATEPEMLERKMRIEDAIHAAKAAVAEGIVAGGGTTYISAIPAVKAYIETLSGDRKTGAAIILRALEQPLRQIAENAGMEPSVVVNEVKSRPAVMGFNAVTGEYVDMFEAGIIDPAKVTRLALQSAASTSAVLLTTQAGVTINSGTFIEE